MRGGAQWGLAAPGRGKGDFPGPKDLDSILQARNNASREQGLQGGNVISGDKAGEGGR